MGPSLVDALDAPEEDKHRLRVVLRTIAAEITIAEACEELRLSESHFHEIRRRALEGALAALEARPTGRPRKARPAEVAEDVMALRARVSELERATLVAQLREDLLMAGDAPVVEMALAQSAPQKKTPPRAEKHRLRRELKRRRKQQHRRAR